MFSWINKNSDTKKTHEQCENVAEGLKNVYRNKLFPLEEAYKFHEFHSPALNDADFDAKPMVLLIGQYSTGKTTFIKYLLESDFPGIRIGPEPTTDKFIVVMHGEQDTVIPGNALVMDTKKQFGPLNKFGNAFLNRFQASISSNSVLDSITIVDTPGILSGEKQRVDRGYEFAEVIEWLAERVDRIILLFDAHKLDISDEFKRVIENLKGYDEKIRIVLNKADMVDHQSLMRVYGALMWSLGKVLNTPEVARVYIGSFWNNPLHFDYNRRLFELEEADLFSDIQDLPRNAALRKLNDLIKRARLAKVHAYIISALKNQMPAVFGKDNKKKELISKLSETYSSIQRQYSISPGDFPDIKRMQEHLQHQDFSRFRPLNQKLLDNVDKMLAKEVADLMKLIPMGEKKVEQEPMVRGGAFTISEESPFGHGAGEGVDKGRNDDIWIVEHSRYKYDEIFRSLNPINGKVTGTTAKAEMLKSKLPNTILGKIWKLSDCDHDGQLDDDEFALACYLIDIKLGGDDIPESLPEHLKPPSKRGALVG